FGRIFQTHVLWAEETLPLAAAQQMLAGHALYRDIWFDKPPGLAWFYAGVLEAAGYSGYGLRLIGALYVLLISLAGYGLGRRLAGETAGRWTAFFLAFFLTFYIHSAVAPLAADLLMLLPHLAVFYFLAESWQADGAVAGWASLAAGLCAGIAFQVNSKALLVLLAAAGWILLGSGRRGPALLRLLAGFAAAAAAGMAVVWLSGGWTEYWQEVWWWGARYAQAPLTGHPWALGAVRTLDYFGFHVALLAGLAAWFWKSEAARRQKRQMAWWLLVSLAGVAAGGRFFPRYYFQLLAPLAVCAAMGWAALAAGPRRVVALAALAVMLALPAVRFGRVNALLAARRSFAWRDVAMDADSRRAAREVARRTKPNDKIFVWGFRPEIYYYAQRIGASRFLESQPLTGVLADRHLQSSEALWPAQAARHREELARQLTAQPPAVLVDGLGPYNPALAMEKYPELAPVLARYRLVMVTRGTRIYGGK
ncbi:MAG TPA: glycosyltransferase family 39 protein, partial [Bryobacterales bacterium]|nr:glycosyltransferase family 39 protein [Bryobacterales bacterium]